ncbi:MAG TPA: DHA2 family efflux MFS transporter permease subunit [Candidatus Dormibacteraeota bacterium]|jgi:EmrB/QacA subfamily drug resistance transporter|nr:DHA2 family efflux MFS transporter permease subunit [Candidatus Dormibacteraeota bacterium]
MHDAIGGRAKETRATSRYVVFATASVALLMGSIDSTIVATALHTLTVDLHASLAWTSWTITGYLLGQTVAMPIAGRLSDSLGRKRMFLVYVVTFTAASLLCGLSVNIYMLIGFRFVQALGGGGFMPSASGLVSDRFGKDRDRAIGLFSSVFPLGALLGPALGGVIITYLPWRAIFFLNVPVGVVLVILMIVILPASERLHAPAIDAAGTALMSAGLFLLMLGINQLGQQGIHAALPWLLLVVGLGLLAGFLVRQEHARHPIIPPSLLRRRAFAIVNVLNLMYGASALGVFQLVPLFAQDAYGMNALEAGTLLTVRAVGMIMIAGVASMAMRRTGYRAPMVVGFLLVAVGVAIMAFPPPQGLGPYGWLGLAALLCGLGVGSAGPASNNAAIDLMPDQVAAISGLRGMFRQVGGIIAVSIAALLLDGSPHPAAVMSGVFVGMAVIALLSVPIIAKVPERRRRGPA